jgi:glycosyltransferase involved in cell wall biosynthesis
MSSAQGSASAAANVHTVLFVSDERGWPRTTGYRRRTSQLLHSMAELGPTTWVVATRNRHDSGEQIELPTELGDRVTVLAAPAPNRSRIATARRWLGSRLPWSLAAGDWRTADEVLASLGGERFDLVWAMGIDALLATRRANISARHVFVDADLESVKLRRQLETGRRIGPLRRLLMRVDRRRWERLERTAAATATGFSVCSEDERRHLGQSAFVTANTYSVPCGQANQIDREGRTGTTVVFIGSLVYQPNIDGLRWFVEEVWPIVINADPTVRLRVIGHGGPDLVWLRSRFGVDVVGPVEDVIGELRDARMTVVPIQWGAGTRIKILESFAHRVPVVSTTVGAEGLHVSHDQELLLADKTSAFADACLRIWSDAALARRLTVAAHGRYLAEYEESVVRHTLTTRLEGILAG